MFRHIIIFEDEVCKIPNFHEDNQKLVHLGIRRSLVKVPKLFFENQVYS